MKAGGSSLISTWRVVHGNYAGKTFEPKEIVILNVAGGSSSLANGTYSETPQYGLGNDFKLVQGKQQSFQSRLEGMNGILRASFQLASR